MLQARLLGPLETELDGVAIDTPASQRPWALFAYLALAGRPVTRAELASRFWPDVLDQSARASLRSALWTIRRRLGDALVVDGERVWLELGEGGSVDIHEFARLADAGEADAALALCRGALLDGVQDDWATVARDGHRERVLAIMEELAATAEPSRAIELTRRQVTTDPFDESAHRRLMARLDAAGDRAGALRVYEALGERLRRELGVAPSAVTRAAAEALRSDAGPLAGVVEPAAPPPRSPLVGRAPELAALQAAFADACAGHGSVAVIRGPAGIGKTRLVAELGDGVRIRSGHVAACAALDLGGSAPLGLWAELIGELLPSLGPPPVEAAWPEELGVLLPELPGLLGRVGRPPVAVAPDLQRARLFEAAAACVSWAATHTPLVLVFEDVHDADPDSLELLAYVARRLPGLAVLVAITRRDLPLAPAADRLEAALRGRGLLGCELDLAGLPAEAIARVADDCAAGAGGALDDAQRSHLVERADGNPLLAVEAARAIATGRSELTPGIRGSVRISLEGAGDSARRCIELAAIAGRALDAAEVASLPLPVPADAAAEALHTGLMVSDHGGLRFRHALLRDAVFAEMAPPRRRGVHLDWARLVAAGDDRAGRPAEVARHLRLAGADADAVPWLARAAEGATAVAALPPAIAFLTEALEIDPARADLWLELGGLEAWLGRRREAEAAFTRGLDSLAAAGAGPAELADGWLRRARAYHGPICFPPAVLDSARRAVELLASATGEVTSARSEALAALAWSEAVAGSPDEAERLIAELAHSDPTSDDDLRIYDVAHARALALMRRGRFVDSYAPSIAAGEAVARAGRPDLTYGCWSNAAGAACAVGDYDRALDFLNRCEEAISGHGLRTVEVDLLAARSFVLLLAGQVDEARRVAEAEWSMAVELQRPEQIATAAHDRGLAELAAGAYGEAARWLTDALSVGDAPISRPLTRLRLAEALVCQGRLDEAEDAIRATALEPIRASDFPASLVARMARVEGLLAAARGDAELGELRLGESVAGWERLAAADPAVETITTVLADLGRPVVGLVDPERELADARADLAAIRAQPQVRSPDAVLP